MARGTRSFKRDAWLVCLGPSYRQYLEVQVHRPRPHSGIDVEDKRSNQAADRHRFVLLRRRVSDHMGMAKLLIIIIIIGLYIIGFIMLLLLLFLYPSVYSYERLKAKKVKIKAGVTIGPERRRSRKCRAEEQS